MRHIGGPTHFEIAGRYARKCARLGSENAVGPPTSRIESFGHTSARTGMYGLRTVFRYMPPENHASHVHHAHATNTARNDPQCVRSDQRDTLPRARGSPHNVRPEDHEGNHAGATMKPKMIQASHATVAWNDAARAAEDARYRDQDRPAKIAAVKAARRKPKAKPPKPKRKPNLAEAAPPYHLHRPTPGPFAAKYPEGGLATVDEALDASTERRSTQAQPRKGYNRSERF